MTIILDKNQLQLTIQRLSHQLMEAHPDFTDVAFIGIQTGGIYLADKIVEFLREINTSKKINYGKLDITFYRDDIRKEVLVPNQTDINFSIENKKVVLIDDVLYTGRTIRAALDALQSFGRPEKVELLVLIDRKLSRQLPIQPDYFGKAIDNIISGTVKVKWDTEEVILF
ncbi:bifunctional pyr operon transcriptional regulator/uracil phosphoribosyltransferase PyrR [soil metagenome]